jgi:Ser/Thr protein kinase RdoA (MazF antagonist)
MVTSMVAGSQVARLQGMGVFVAEGTGVLVGLGVNVVVGIFDVGEASRAMRVNSAATVWAAWVNTASGASRVAVPALLLLGRLHAATSSVSKPETRSDFFIRFLLNYCQ